MINLDHLDHFLPDYSEVIHELMTAGSVFSLGLLKFYRENNYLSDSQLEAWNGSKHYPIDLPHQVGRIYTESNAWKYELDVDKYD